MERSSSSICRSPATCRVNSCVWRRAPCGGPRNRKNCASHRGDKILSKTPRTSVRMSSRRLSSALQARLFGTFGKASLDRFIRGARVGPRVQGQAQDLRTSVKSRYASKNARIRSSSMPHHCRASITREASRKRGLVPRRRGAAKDIGAKNSISINPPAASLRSKDRCPLRLRDQAPHFINHLGPTHRCPPSEHGADRIAGLHAELPIAGDSAGPRVNAICSQVSASLD